MAIACDDLCFSVEKRSQSMASKFPSGFKICKRVERGKGLASSQARVERAAVLLTNIRSKTFDKVLKRVDCLTEKQYFYAKRCSYLSAFPKRPKRCHFSGLDMLIVGAFKRYEYNASINMLD